VKEKQESSMRKSSISRLVTEVKEATQWFRAGAKNLGPIVCMFSTILCMSSSE
jgi:hypothetical protein